MEYGNLESAYHSGEITKPTQLTLHAALGCASASAAGGDCASGAVAGVVGELAAETYADYALII